MRNAHAEVTSPSTEREIAGYEASSKREREVDWAHAEDSIGRDSVGNQNISEAVKPSIKTLRVFRVKNSWY